MSSLKLKTPGGGSVSFNATDTASDVTLTVPASNASVLTDSSNIPAANLTGSLPAGMGGKVLQVLQAVKTDAFSTTSTSLVDVSGLSVSITPSSTSSKILVHIDLCLTASYYIGHAQLVRNSTLLYRADSAGNRPIDTITFSQNPSNDGISQRSSAMYLDSPSTTSATTYKVQASTRKDGQGSGVFYINRTVQDRDTTGYDARGVSSITVMEIAG